MAEIGVLGSLIIGRPLCVDCIALKCATSVDGAVAALAHLRTLVHLTTDEAGRCRNCGTIGRTYAIGAPTPARD